MKMNPLVILIFLISTALSQFGGINNAKCLKELGMTKEDLMIIKRSSPQDPKLKCFFRCLLEKFQLIADDKIIPGAFKTIMGPKLSAKKVKLVESVCHKATPGKGKCDFGHSLFRCYNSLIRNDILLWRKRNRSDN